MTTRGFRDRQRNIVESVFANPGALISEIMDDAQVGYTEIIACNTAGYVSIEGLPARVYPTGMEER